MSTTKKKSPAVKPISLEDAFEAAGKAKGKVDKGYNRFDPLHKDYDDPLDDNEDEESVSKQMKKKGKAEFDGPKVKERKKFAPATKVEKPKKGKGSYTRDKKVQEFKENSEIINFIKCLSVKNYALANKYLNNAVELKIQDRINSELETPLFK